MAKQVDKAAQKAAKKEARAAKRAKSKQTRSQIWQAFNLQRKRDNKLIPLMLLAVLGMGLLFFLIGLLFGGQWFMLFIGLLLGVVVAMIIFSRRLEKSMYDEVGNTPGAAGWTLENMRNTMGIAWITKTGVQANTHMDTVHRVVGNPGVVLVGEGEPGRLKKLVEKEHKRVDRLLAGVPIYEVYVGDGEGQVPVRDVQKHLLKLPKNYKKDEVYNINAKLEAMDARQGQMTGLPGGPVPRQAQNMAGMNRRMRRMQERKGK
jgi:F0F1-type ATP synthase assembly protein I